MKAREVPVVSPPAQPWDVDCQAAHDGLTKQEFVKDCDVNHILARCLRLGTPLPGADVLSAFADVSDIGDFPSCVRRVKAAEEAFLTLPVEIRAEFNHDAASLISFLDDPANHPRAIELGLLNKPVEPVAPSPVAPVTVAPPGAPAA
nr:MAG: internal scaffolding protein [Microvirus sp.]